MYLFSLSVMERTLWFSKAVGLIRGGVIFKQIHMLKFHICGSNLQERNITQASPIS